MYFNFNFEDVDGCGENVSILVYVKNFKAEKGVDLYSMIEDAISSYIEYVTDWQYEDVVSDVLSSFNLDFEIINPVVFNI